MGTDVRAQVWAKTQGHCWYCGKRMNPWDDFTVDHMDPRKNGGGDELENLVPSCKSCNSRKNAKTVEEYRIYVQEKAEHRFWYEHAMIPLLQASGGQEELSEEEEPELYERHITSWAWDCLEVGRHFSPGLALTLMALMLDALQHYREETDLESMKAFGDWFFHVESLSTYTRQTVDEVFGHVMQIHALGLMDFTWNVGPNNGHTYTFFFHELAEKAVKYRTEDRAKGLVSYLP